MALILLLLIPLFCAAPAPAAAQEPPPLNARADEARETEDKLRTSLFFRGEAADLIISAGAAQRLVDTEGLGSYSELRSEVMRWISRNYRAAAELYLQLKGGSALPPQKVEYYHSEWTLNPGFLSLVRDLNAAAGSRAMPGEALEQAARRLYGGREVEPGGGEVVAGGRAAGGGTFAGEYSDYRLNRAGLEKEIAAAGAWLDAARGPGGRGHPGLEREFAAALAEYGAFVAAAAAVKGRSALNAFESKGLEARRAVLRGRLAGLALRARAADLEALTGAMGAAGEPGSLDLLAAASGLAGRLAAAAERAEAGRTPLSGLGAAVREAEGEYAAFYLRYTVYNALLQLKRGASGAAYSCLQDYLVHAWLARARPGAAYPRARALLAGAAARLDPALAAAGRGEAGAALDGLGAAAKELAAAAETVRRASAANRRMQFLQWGFLFRPVEYDAFSRRAFFAPVEIFPGK